MASSGITIKLAIAKPMPQLGTGVGVAIAEQVAECLNGDVRSQRVDRGGLTTVLIAASADSSRSNEWDTARVTS